VDIPTVDDMVRSTSTAYFLFPNLITPVAASAFPSSCSGRRPAHNAHRSIHYAEGLGRRRAARALAVRLALRPGHGGGRNEHGADAAVARSPGLRHPDQLQERRIWHFNEEVDRAIGVERAGAAARPPCWSGTSSDQKNSEQ
jgi:hypothetical protein